MILEDPIQKNENGFSASAGYGKQVANGKQQFSFLCTGPGRREEQRGPRKVV